MARVFLNDETYNAASDDAEINGSAGTEQVNVFAGVTGLDVTSSVERVDLSGDIADFTFSSFGNSVTILDGNGDTVAAVSGADGKQLVFGDGALDVAFDAGTNELTVGGETVDGNAAAITPAASEIDATTTSESANGGGNGGGGAGGGGAAQTFTLTESANTVAEGDTVTYTVTADSAVTADTTLTVSVSGSDLNGAATAASATDYTLSDTSVTFADGAAAGSTQTFTVTANTDDIAEGVEGIKVSLLDDTFATVASETTAITNVESAQTYVLTNDQNQTTGGADNFTGTAQDDTFIATADGALGNGDVIDGAGGTDTLNARYSLDADTTVNASVSNVEQLNIDHDDGDAGTEQTLTMSVAFDGLTEVNVQNAGGSTDTNEDNIVLNQAAAGVDLGIENGDGEFDVTFALASTAGTSDAVTANLDTADVDTVTIAGVETVTLNAENGDSEIDTLTTTAATALNITGTGGLTVTDVDDATVTIDGTAATGDVSLAGIGAVDSAITMGSGDDTVNIGGNLDADDTIDGGDGTDRVIVSVSETAALANVTDVEELEFNDDATDDTNFEISGLVNAALDTFVIDALDNDDGGVGSTITVSNLDSGDTVRIEDANAETGGDDGINVTGTLTTDGIADAVSLELVGLGNLTATGAGGTTGVGTITLAAHEVINVSSLAANNVTVNNVEDLSISSATTLNLSGAADLDIEAVTNTTELSTIDASGLTGDLTIIGLDASDVTFTGGSGTTALTMAGLNASDTITGSSADDDVLSATGVTGLTATTGALNITDVETVNLTTTGDNTLSLANISGVNTLSVTGDDAQTITNVGAGVAIGLGDANDTFGDTGGGGTSGEVTVSLADATGTSDSLTLAVDNTSAATSDIDATIEDVETVNITFEEDGNNAQMNLAAVEANTINVSGGAAGTVLDLADGTDDLNVSVTDFDASGFAGSVLLDRADGTAAATIALAGDTGIAHSVTGATAANDTITIGSASAGTTDAVTVAGGVGQTDTLNLFVDGNFADFSNVTDIEQFNITVEAAADNTITDATGLNDAETDNIVLTGGNVLSTFATDAATAVGSAAMQTIDASGFAGNIDLEIVEAAVDAGETLTISAGGLSTDTISLTTTNSAAVALNTTGVEEINILEDTGASTIDFEDVVGATLVALDTDADLTLNNLASGVVIQAGLATTTQLTADAGVDGATVDINLDSASGASDALTINVADTDDADATATFDVDDVETITMDVVETAAGNIENHIVSLAGTTNTNDVSLVLTGGDAANTFGFANNGIVSSVTSIDASDLDSALTIDAADRGATALTITGGFDGDSIAMENTGDVLTGGAGTDTLVIDFNAILGGIEVDLSATDQVVSMNGSANGAVQSGFENVDLSSFSGFGAVVTGSDDANTITGTANADQITGGAGADTIDGGAGDDNITGGAGDDTFVYNEGDGADTINDFAVGDDAFDLDNTAGNLVQDGGGNGNVDITGVDIVDAGADLTIADGLLIIDNGDADIADADGLTAANIADRLNDLSDDNNGTGADNIVSFNNANDEFLVAISDGTNTVIAEVDAGGGDTDIDAGEITVLMTLVGVSDAGTLTAANFDGFTL